MKILKNIKTSDRITLFFSLSNFVSLIVLLLCINITYFFIWYNEQKEESLYDMTTNYSALIGNSYISNQQAFLEYILQKDTIILSESGEQGLICSDGVSEKLHNDMNKLEEVKDSLFYRDGDTIYFIFSKYYKGIGEVKIFFDTTDYIRSQIIIIQVSAALIFLWLFISLLWGKMISGYALRGLKNISSKAKQIDVGEQYTPMNISGSDDDEIKILADTLDSAFQKIETQTSSLKQFITDVSHEFKTPLMVINSDIDVYEKKKEKGKLEKDADKIFLENMKLKTAKLNKLIETLFLLTRMEENISKLQFRKRDLDSLIRDLVEEKISGYANTDIKVNYNLESGISKNIEESSFNIIIENLISNAVKFSEEPIKIDVSLNNKRFSIKDYGSGMSETEQKKVWEKFYRKDTKVEGFGIGLYLVKRIVSLYKWSIDLESKKDKYTEFTILFNNH